MKSSKGLHDDLIKKLIYLGAKIGVNYLDPLSYASTFAATAHRLDLLL